MLPKGRSRFEDTWSKSFGRRGQGIYHLRADSGFCRWRTLSWCERHGVDYIVGLAKNIRTLAMAKTWTEQAEERYEELGCKQKLFGEFSYAAESWDCEHPVDEITPAYENIRARL